jgi:hypothetical protein
MLRIRLLLLLSMISVGAGAYANGFDNNFEVYKRDQNEDGYTDLYVRQKPQIVLIDFDVPIPILVPSPVDDFVLIQDYVNQTFTIEEAPNNIALSQWQTTGIQVSAGDVNVDGARDAVLKGIAADVTGMLDQVVFASVSGTAIPTSVRKVDTTFERFYRDGYRWLLNQNYLEGTKVPTNTPSYLYAVILDVSACWNFNSIIQTCIEASDVLESTELMFVPDGVVGSLPYLSNPAFSSQAIGLLDSLTSQALASNPPVYNQFSPTYGGGLDGCYYYCEHDSGWYLGEFFSFSIYDVFIPTSEQLNFFDKENYSLEALQFSQASGSALHDGSVARQTDPAAAEQILEGVLGRQLGDTAAGLLGHWQQPSEVWPVTDPPFPRRPIPTPPIGWPPPANDPDWFPKKKWIFFPKVFVVICGLLTCSAPGEDIEAFRWKNFGEEWGAHDLAERDAENNNATVRVVIGESEGPTLPNERIQNAAQQYDAIYFMVGSFSDVWSEANESRLWYMNEGWLYAMMLRGALFVDIGRYQPRAERGRFYPCERDTMESYPFRDQVSSGQTLDWNYGPCLLRRRLYEY